LRIKKMTIENFKGIRNFTFEPNGENASVFGMNETGKTTLVDAFLFLLFGKDSEGRKDFAIKPLDENNNPIPGLETMVECEFMDGLVLKKTYYEMWVKQKGSTDKVFSGNTTDYFIDGVPTKAGDYANRIKIMATEDVFKLLTNPLYFHEGLHWTKRRELLLQICGDVSDDDVIGSNKNLVELKDILGKHNYDDKKKILIAQKKNINEQLEKLPVRIDEADKSKPDIEGLKFDFIDSEIKRLQKEKSEKEQEIASIESGGESGELQKKITVLDAKIQTEKNKHNTGKDKAVREIKNQIGNIEDEITRLNRLQDIKKTEKAQVEKVIKEKEKAKTELADEWRAIKAEKYEKPIEDVSEDDGTCPYCGQKLPENMIEEAKRKAAEALVKAEEDFNLNRSKKLEENVKKGMAFKTEIDGYKKSIDSLDKVMQEAEASIIEKKTELEKLKVKLTGTEKKYSSIKIPGYQEMLSQRDELQKKIDDSGKDTSSQTKLLTLEKEGLDEEISALQVQYAKKEQHEKAEKRIKELMEEQKRLATEFEEIVRQLYLMDEFTKAKVSMLDKKINSKFKYARFKMFNTLVNGGIEDCCEILVTNSITGAQVPFSSANNGGKILVGCDIISTFSENYDFYPVVFVDNYESITSPIEMKNQVIELVVSTKDKKLRVEYWED
jgi:DNA repair exonuclease SbcCD ATPase subunit